MSADSYVVFVGLAFAVAPDEREGLEERSDARIKRARAHRLDHYWGDFANSGEILLVGKRLAYVGPEGVTGLRLSRDEFLRLLEAVTEKLAQAGWHEPPKLILEYQPD